MTIRWLTTAEHDLIALTEYIAEDNPHTTLQIFNKIRLSIDKLRIHPYLGRERRIKRTREIVIPNLPYIVVYLVTKEIRILAVLHTTRKWPEEFD